MADPTPEREPTADEQAGIQWYNSLSEVARGYWLRRVGTMIPADAWAAYKRDQEKPCP